MPQIVLARVEISAGKIMLSGKMLPALVLSERMVVGTISRLVVLSTMNIIVFVFAFNSFFESRSTALIPLGVQALPNPKMFAVKLSVTNSLVTGSSCPKSKVVKGLSSFVHFLSKPQSLIICIMPNQKA